MVTQRKSYLDIEPAFGSIRQHSGARWRATIGEAGDGDDLGSVYGSVSILEFLVSCGSLLIAWIARKCHMVSTAQPLEW